MFHDDRHTRQTNMEVLLWQSILELFEDMAQPKFSGFPNSSFSVNKLINVKSWC